MNIGRKFNLGMVSAVVAAGTMVSAGHAASAATSAAPPHHHRTAAAYRYLSLANHPGWCVDIPDNSTLNGTKVQLWKCHDVPQEMWRWDPNTWAIVSESGKCLDDTAGGGSGTMVQIWTCNLDDQQHWNHGAFGVGDNSWYNVTSGDVLDNRMDCLVDGNPIQVWSWLANDQQQWSSLNS